MKFVLLSGNPIDGIEIYGPFNTAEEAAEFGERVQGDWWVAKLVKPS